VRAFFLVDAWKGEALRIGYALAVAATVGVLAVPATGLAAPPEGSLHLTTVSLPEQDTFSLAKKQFTFGELVYQRGKLVGTNHAVCRWTAQFENIRCRMTVSLPKGKLFIFLRIGPDPQGSFIVTRGTGTYAGRTGIGIYHNVSDTATKVTIWLT
jgi:hypothetical protein